MVGVLEHNGVHRVGEFLVLDSFTNTNSKLEWAWSCSGVQTGSRRACHHGDVDKYELGGLTELGHGVEHVVGHGLCGPILKMGGPRLLYLLVGLQGGNH